MSMLKGANTPVPARQVRVEVGWASGASVPPVDVSALLLAAGTGGVRSDADLVRRDRPAHASGAVRHEGAPDGAGGAVQVLAVDLDAVEAGVEKVVVAVSAGGAGFGEVPGLHVRLVDAASGAELARYDSADATVETALVLGELYRRQGAWKFRAVGQGYSAGPEGLAKDFGLSAAAVRPAPPAPAPSAPAAPAAAAPARATASAPASAPVSLSKVTLTKESPRVSLAKQGGTSGAMRVNLSWQMRKQPKGGGWGAKLGRALAGQGGLDLDLCALFELTDGRKGVVQSLGNAFGALHQPPYIHLDGDDRTGGTSGENLTVNLDHRDSIRRIVIFVTIYAGASSFADLDATVTLRPEHGAPIEFSLGECTVPSTVCALALITNTGSDLVVQREADFLVPERGVSPQRTMDRAYGWGMDWTPGRK
ncbi:TerD family protein [Streptomyces sp. NPDC001985]|uniref:TerD family protein n=1 Tax=Streptomyces sp. NPDC001985 TaxID=3154406 RepID=UPI003319CEC6